MPLRDLEQKSCGSNCSVSLEIIHHPVPPVVPCLQTDMPVTEAWSQGKRECTGFDLPSFHWCINLSFSYSLVLSCSWLFYSWVVLCRTGPTLMYSMFSGGFLHLTWAPVIFSPTLSMFDLWFFNNFVLKKVLFLFWSQLWIHLNIFIF